MIQDIYTVKELAQKWKSSQETVRNLIHDNRLRPMKMPTLIIPLFEVERFEKEMVATQEDLSKYADKQFAKKYLDKKEPTPIVEIRKKELQNA
ncbi:MerR family transcriptional regulator [Vagococcus fluvialis]|uniref:helix-turn-helix domain-containing protein n=1 Tax=Vagococcus fluvialis TaxID=2738 RepID=UPI001D0AD20D|nr:helix-turn-helix domain-containing protein [Vagococcus fluvialis]UDM72426.1 helix-turn-helix domain-containing protein [Vagococcus fluvialis]UDM77291.1 helix-turn-helix domain-containing protein [Vagococcus fluvialis]UDM81561.1 helix-turn-helix domain-containing protein [Vagococcus fluvialis]